MTTRERVQSQTTKPTKRHSGKSRSDRDSFHPQRVMRGSVNWHCSSLWRSRLDLAFHLKPPSTGHPRPSNRSCQLVLLQPHHFRNSRSFNAKNMSVSFPLTPLEGNPKSSSTPNSRRPSQSSAGRPDPLSSVTHASVRACPAASFCRCRPSPDFALSLSVAKRVAFEQLADIGVQASRIGPGAHPTGHPVGLADTTQLSPEENAKRLAAYAAVDEHVKSYHKVLGIGSVATSIYVLPFQLGGAQIPLQPSGQCSFRRLSVAHARA